MPNFKQIDYKRGTRTPIKNKDIEAQQVWLESHLDYLTKVESYNQLIKKTFVCHTCGKRIANPRWVFTIDPESMKVHYHHSKRQCNPHYSRICLNCGKNFRIKRKSQKLCSKKCSVKYITSPILLRRCSTCGKEFKTRIIANNQNNESNCLGCR